MFFDKKKKQLQHSLKWSIPEARKTAELKEVNQAIETLKVKAKFLSGGQFKDVIYSKQFGDTVFAYFIIRTDARTEEEKLIFDGYMLEEDEKLNFDVSSSYSIMPNLERMGYFEGFERNITLWSFSYAGLPVNVYSVDGFGDFIEVTLPQTKLENARKVAESNLLKILHALGIDPAEILETDLITLQLSKMIEEQQKQG
jgi:adenylate cyclase class IV